MNGADTLEASFELYLKSRGIIDAGGFKLIKAVTSCSTHKIDQQETQMVKILKYDNPDHKIKLKIRQFQVMGKSTGQINNIGYKWYIGS